MRKLLIIVTVFALLSAGVLASYMDSEYLTIVRDEAGAADVIAAANFAAQMQAQAGVGFSGATESQVAALGDISNRMRVYFDGKTARIVLGKNDPSAHARAADIAEAYLKTQGYTVTRETTRDEQTSNDGNGAGGGNSAGSDNSPAEENENATSPAPNVTAPRRNITPPKQGEDGAAPTCIGCPVDGRCIATGETYDDKVCLNGSLAAKKASGEACAYSYECLSGSCVNASCAAPLPPDPEIEVPKAQPTVIDKIVGWFRRLFS